MAKKNEVKDEFDSMILLSWLVFGHNNCIRVWYCESPK